jgi:hypothetical protein
VEGPCRPEIDTLLGLDKYDEIFEDTKVQKWILLRFKICCSWSAWTIMEKNTSWCRDSRPPVAPAKQGHSLLDQQIQNLSLRFNKVSLSFLQRFKSNLKLWSFFQAWLTILSSKQAVDTNVMADEVPRGQGQF